MKYTPAKILLPVLSLAALVLASCGTSAKAASINQLAPEVNTAVAATLTAEPTNTPVSTSTPTLTPTPTATQQRQRFPLQHQYLLTRTRLRKLRVTLPPISPM